MKITLITSNHVRHNYLINSLSGVCKELFVIQECKTYFPGLMPGKYKVSKIVDDYFNKVRNSEKLFFFEGGSYIKKSNNVSILSLAHGDLNQLTLDFLANFLNSDLYIIFGSSFLKGEIASYLVKKKAINIHMGVSPYYRGADCNFWALYDNNPNLVGATIHLLSTGLDNGPILYHAVSKIRDNTFDYSMSTVKSAFHSIIDRIKNETIFTIKPSIQDKTNEIRYSKKEDFNEKVINEFLKDKKIISNKKIDFSLLKDPYLLND